MDGAGAEAVDDAGAATVDDAGAVPSQCWCCT